MDKRVIIRAINMAITKLLMINTTNKTYNLMITIIKTNKMIHMHLTEGKLNETSHITTNMWKITTMIRLNQIIRLAIIFHSIRIISKVFIVPISLFNNPIFQMNSSMLILIANNLSAN